MQRTAKISAFGNKARFKSLRWHGQNCLGCTETIQFSDKNSGMTKDQEPG
jgi:hypothetical protein